MHMNSQITSITEPSELYRDASIDFCKTVHIYHTERQAVYHGAYYRGNLEGVVGSSVVNVMAEAGEEEGKDLQVCQEGEMVTALVEDVAEVGHRECMVPIVIGWVPVTTFYHQNKPVEQGYTSLVSEAWEIRETYLASVFG